MKKIRKTTKGVLNGITIISFVLMACDSEDWGVFIISHLILLAIMIGSGLLAMALDEEN